MPLAAKNDAGSGRTLLAGLRAVEVEQRTLAALHAALAVPPLSHAFERAVSIIAETTGRVVVTGMGKSGLIGRKIASTLSSTGTPSFFLHPAEASHGDLGMIATQDVVLAMSWSGETAELFDVIHYCRRYGVCLVAITSRAESTLAANADIAFVLPKVEEACPNQLAPTSSTISQLSLGDAIAVALVEARGFSINDFRVFHPKGQLGAQLLRVSDLMGVENTIPTVRLDVTIRTAMQEMSAKSLGVTGIVDDAGLLIGAFSDGDLRRSLIVTGIDAPVRDHMTANPIMIGGDRPASEALAIMNSRQVMQLFVGDDRRVSGILHMHDILRAGVV